MLRPILVLALLAGFFGILVFGSLNALSLAVGSRNPSGTPIVAAECRVAGCSNELCVDSGVGAFSDCAYRAEYGCYRTARCERQSNGRCGWSATPQLTKCLEPFTAANANSGTTDPS